MRTIIVTASDDTFMPLLRGLVNSLRQFENPLPLSDIGCLDVGLNAENRAWIYSEGIGIVEPKWDLPVDTALRERTPHLRSLTARPFLPAYFPGYDVYIWIDCDAWVQEQFVLEWLSHTSASGALGIVAELDRSYDKTLTASWRADRLRRYYDETAAQEIGARNYYNAGVFALRADAPHWTHWAESFEHGLRATDGTVVCDQTALNHAIWSRSLPVHPLPSICNWLCHLALPHFDIGSRKFCEPYFPHATIGIVHLAAYTKDLTFRLHNENGPSPAEISLRFQGPQAQVVQEKVSELIQ